MPMGKEINFISQRRGALARMPEGDRRCQGLAILFDRSAGLAVATDRGGPRKGTCLKKRMFPRVQRSAFHAKGLARWAQKKRGGNVWMYATETLLHSKKPTKG